MGVFGLKTMKLISIRTKHKKKEALSVSNINAVENYIVPRWSGYIKLNFTA
jgi:hypothetical protein